MRYYKYFGTLTTLFLFILSCSYSPQNENKNKGPINSNKSTQNKNTSDHNKKTEKIFTDVEIRKKVLDFVPKGYIIYKEIYGDLNNDKLEDCILVIKGTDVDKIIVDESRGELDRNRRGIVILLRRKDTYQLGAINYDCFSSENEDGGVYYPPELLVYIEKGNLYIHYPHGRYGHWKYTFKLKNSDFELIGYDSSSSFGPVIISETSINFLTKKKFVRKNINENVNIGEEVFVETWTDIKLNKPIKLIEVKDFDQFGVSNFE